MRRNDIPQQSALWAAGWTAMSDLSRIECDQNWFDAGLKRPRRISSGRKSSERVRAIGLTAGALSAVMSLSVALWFLPNG